jgi:hypothetical protein
MLVGNSSETRNPFTHSAELHGRMEPAHRKEIIIYTQNNGIPKSVDAPSGVRTHESSVRPAQHAP